MAVEGRGGLAQSPLERVLLREGAAMVARHGWWIAAHFGSPPGEIAVCETAVGLADRSDLGKFELRGERDSVETVVGQLAGVRMEPGDAVRAGGAWWGSVSPEHAIVLCAPPEAERLRGAIEETARGVPELTVQDSTRRLAALGLLGPATGALLDELWSAEPLADPVDAPQLEVTMLAAVPVMVLRESADRALVLTARERAEELWSDAGRAGAELGLGHVGADAVERVALAGR